MKLDTLTTFRVGLADVNGLWRVKRVPGSYATKLDGGAVRMPFSACNIDLWGADVEDSPLVFETGDKDAMMLPTDRGAVPMPWLENSSALVPVATYDDSGTPFDGDPRHALASVLKKYAARGWTVIAATELEFTLIDDSGDAPQPPLNPLTGRRLSSDEVLSMTEMDSFDAFITELYDGCAAMGIPAQASINESGIGQFEVNLGHQDAMRCADDTLLFKTLIRGLARRHGYAATFMAKPYLDDAGNGMHVHFSVVDQNGKNVFNDGSETGNDILQNAVAGCLAAMADSTAIFAPLPNSYARLVVGAHAPTSACWGYDNRTTAIRIPGGSPKARRIEHRVPGGDINPYLMLAAVLGAAMIGIEDGMTPPLPAEGNAYESDAPQLAPDLDTALDLMEKSDLMRRILPQQMIDCFVMTKRQESRRFAELATEQHWLRYIDSL